MRVYLLVMASALLGTAVALVCLGVALNDELPIWCGFLVGALGAGALALADR